jgi:hypothetical protein
MPSLYAVNTGLHKGAIVIQFKNTKNFDTIGKRRHLEYFVGVQKLLIKILNGKGPKAVP